MPAPSPPSPRLLLADTLRASRRAMLAAGFFSGLVNILALTGSIYMLQLYDRVIPSHSMATLVGITIIMLVLYAGYGLLDLARTRILAGIGMRIERGLREKVFAAVLLTPLRARTAGDGLQPVRDLDQIRGFLSGPGPTALFDLPWLPFYLLLVYLLHPWLGHLAAAGALVLVALTILTEVRSRALGEDAARTGAERSGVTAALHRGAESLRALGMTGRAVAQLSRHSEEHLASHKRATDVIATYGAMSRVLRMVLQSLVLGLGAWLVIRNEATGGVMIAASIMVARALAPIEIAIANWRGFVAARQSAHRLAGLIDMTEPRTNATELPAPHNSLAVEELWVGAPGSPKPIVQNASFALKAGDGLGIIGPSASGKSTLARALVGAWLPLRGAIRLDGALIGQWSPDRLGASIGYLSQDVELMEGTIAQNIARFDPDATSESVIAAARSAGVHEMIVQLVEGYDTPIGNRGLVLSAGQRQRVGLARALYGAPFLVVLDEPNSNLDAEGDAALTRAVAEVRARGGIVIVIAHRPSALAGLDTLMVMGKGQVQAFGPKDDVLRQATQQAAAAAAGGSRLKVISDGAAAAERPVGT